MRTIRTDAELNRFLKVLRTRSEGVNQNIRDTVLKILEDVKTRGDRAVREYTSRFDHIDLKDLRLTSSEINRYAKQTDSETKKALEVAAERIRAFHERQLEQSWTYRDNGALLGQIIRPLRRVGVYVPGGKASYPSTVLMNVIPAQVAAVEEIALTVPTPEGEVNPALMYAIRLLGVREVYRIGGAQAIGALAYGTESIKRVDKIVGPGNIYVAEAKRMVFGTVDIDMIAGPSEILIIADSKADADFVAADMLSQAEHDEMASAVLITTSETLAKKVIASLKGQLRRLKRGSIANSSLARYGAIIVTKSLKQAVTIANEIAPEHLEIMTEKPERLLPDIRNAGAIFLGSWTPEPIGDYAAGPNHTLPTGGTARFSSPLGVYDFLKRSSLIKFSKKAFIRLAPVVEQLADIEGLEAHGNTIRIRRQRG